MNKSTLLSVIFILFVTCLIFFKLFLKGLYPIPGDLLVSFYFPYYSGGWEGYNSYTTHKELLGADSIRQIYLWKEFAAQQFKIGQIPLWNPFTFSGQPLLANFQSSVFYPLNIFYFLTDPRNAWTILIVAQPFLGGLFMFLAARSFKLSKIASLFSAISFMFSSYLITWMENGNVAHSYIWLPLIIWAINEYFRLYKLRFNLLLIIALTMSILGGHPQTVIYLYIATFIYWIFKSQESRKNQLHAYLLLAIGLISPFLVAGLQVVPTIDFYSKSPISLPFSAEVFDRAILPYQNLVTFFAADFFGHPASNNFWSQTYGDFTPYIGVIPIVFALWAIVALWREKFVKFASLVSVFFIIAAVSSPVTWAIKTFEIPLLNSTTPSRFVTISIFFLAILVGFGLQDFLENFKKKVYLRAFSKFLILIGIIYFALWVFAVFGHLFLKPQEPWQINLAVTRRNLIIPTVMFLSLPIGILLMQFLSSKFKLIKNWSQALIIAGIFAVTLYGGLFFSNKFLPVSPKSFFFPKHSLFDWLKENAGINRFYGQGTARIDFNFPIHYQVYVAEGYDTLRLKRYAELLAAARNNGKIPVTYPRSDAAFPDEENGYRKRLFDLLGVKFLLDKEDTPKTGQDWNPGKFPNDNVEGFWQNGKFLVYVRKNVLPRVFLSTNYTILKSDQEIIDKVFDKNFDLRTIILEENPHIKVENYKNDIVEPKILKYNSNEATFATNIANSSSILFLSDAYDDDWNVYVDGKRSKILRASYAFRAVAVPQGEHIINFKYQPRSFVMGALVSMSSILILIVLSVHFARKKQF